uniref:Uncharacterized protein n=1 Tax=Daucus carota subsp. sativus TaxID=79200 RepID=A0A164T4V5_DAUCS
MESQDSGHTVSLVASADTRGKHRIIAELRRLEQEARILEAFHILEFCCLIFLNFAEELDQIEKMEKASPACKELLVNVESRPDPLLAM